MRDGKESPPVFCRTKEAADIQIAIANMTVIVINQTNNINSLQYFNFPCFGPNWSVTTKAVEQNNRYYTIISIGEITNV
jgi:hypothetical protein